MLFVRGGLTGTLHVYIINGIVYPKTLFINWSRDVFGSCHVTYLVAVILIRACGWSTPFICHYCPGHPNLGVLNSSSPLGGLRKLVSFLVAAF